MKDFIKRGGFVARQVKDGIEVWIPPFDDGAGEFICAVHTSLIPDLIAVLTAIKPRKHCEKV